jgi:hypothetical protein
LKVPLLAGSGGRCCSSVMTGLKIGIRLWGCERSRPPAESETAAEGVEDHQLPLVAMCMPWIGGSGPARWQPGEIGIDWLRLVGDRVGRGWL